MSYSFPRDLFIIFEETFGKEKAKIAADSLERSIEEIVKESNSSLKANLKDELKGELATKGDLNVTETRLKAETDNIKSEIKLLDFKLNVVVAISLLALTLFNPALLTFLTKLFKL